MTDLFRYSVVIPTKDRGPIVLGTARSLTSQECRPERLIVVDASEAPPAAPDDLDAELAEAGIELIVASARPSTSGQRNVGIDLVETPLVMFMDDDVVLPPDYARVLIERWRRAGFEELSGIVGALRGNPIPKAAPDRLYRRVFQLHYYDPAADGVRFRLSQKLRYNDAPAREVFVESTSTMAVIYRTDLAAKHRFDERFEGYVLGEDHDFAARIRREAPILLVPDVKFVHERAPGERGSPDRWYHRGRREAYFRLRRLERSPRARAAFGLSVVGELIGAAVDSVRERTPSHVGNYLGGFAATVRDSRTERALALRLKPTPYYVLNHAYRRSRIVGRRALRPEPAWAGIRILGYHRVLPARDVLAVAPDEFRAHLEWLLELGVQPIRLDRALPLLEAEIEERFFAVTFDDGYRDNLEHAVPILAELAVPATIYIPTAIVDRLSTFAWYRHPPPALTWSEIDEIVAGGLVDVQAHTRTHRPLTRLPESVALEEMAGSKADLESRLQYEVTSIAYPAGIYGQRETLLARRAGFRAAVTTTPGVNRGGQPLYELRRTLVAAGDTFDDFRAKVDGCLDRPTAIERLVRARRASAIG